jgi:hypothetical protein
MDAAALGFPVLVALIAVALLFDFLNGLHDAANSIATVVATRVLRPQTAVMWAAFFNFIAFVVFGLHVAQTVGTGIVSAGVVDGRVIFGALTGAIVWNIVTWNLGIPSSSSHALIGGLTGAAIAKAGFAAVIYSGLAITALGIVLSPLLGFVLAQLLVVIVQWASRRSTPFAVDRRFRVLQLVSASLYSLGHGGNDAQKTMGIIAVLLFSQGMLSGEFHVPVLGGDQLPGGNGARNAARRLAHRSHHGLAHHAVEARPGVLRGDRRRVDALSRDRAGSAGVDDAHHHRSNRGRRRGAADGRRSVARRSGDRHRLDTDASGGGDTRWPDVQSCRVPLIVAPRRHSLFPRDHGSALRSSGFRASLSGMCRNPWGCPSPCRA